ncbi:MAG TPA: glycosyltransferase family 9 protein [Ktedonobacterales bacterium]
MRDMARGTGRQLAVLEAAPIRRIAILRALQLGDLLLAVPALRSIRDRFPRAEITLIGLPWAQDFARRFSRYVNRFIAFPGYPGIAEAPYAPARTAHFFSEQRACGYDLAIQMHGNGAASNGFCRELGARLSVGYYGDEKPEGLAIAAPYPEGAHEIARNLGLACLLGATCLTTALEFPLRPADTVEAARLLRPIASLPRPWIGLHAGARAPSRRWPAERFAAVAATLTRCEGATIILTGGSDEVETARAVAALMEVATQHAPEGEAGLATTALEDAEWSAREATGEAGLAATASARSPRPVRLGATGDDSSSASSASLRALRVPRNLSDGGPLNLAGRTSLGGLAAVIRRLDLYITNDTGPSHLAEAVGTPSITLFGPADPRRWAPLDAERHPILRAEVACSPCGFTACPIDHACLRRISSARVVALAERLMRKGAAACRNA